MRLRGGSLNRADNLKCVCLVERICYLDIDRVDIGMETGGFYPLCSFCQLNVWPKKFLSHLLKDRKRRQSPTLIAGGNRP